MRFMKPILRDNCRTEATFLPWKKSLESSDVAIIPFSMVSGIWGITSVTVPSTMSFMLGTETFGRAILTPLIKVWS